MKQDTPANISFIEPMKALQVRELPVGNWIYELKFDGYRALAFKADREVRLVSRNRTVFNNDYPQLIDSLKLLTAKAATIDGEIAALDQNGKSSSSFFSRTERPSKPHSSITPSICSSWMGPICALDRSQSDASCLQTS